MASLSGVEFGKSLRSSTTRRHAEQAAAESGVPDQPWGDEETIRGALARARAARVALDADWGIGIEGGVIASAHESVRTCAWAAVVSLALTGNPTPNPSGSPVPNVQVQWTLTQRLTPSFDVLAPTTSTSAANGTSPLPMATSFPSVPG